MRFTRQNPSQHLLRPVRAWRTALGRCGVVVIVGLAGPAFAEPEADAPPPLEQTKGCIEYDGETVSIRGKIRLESFPGPPNFTSIHRGDEVVPEFVLELDDPICVAAVEEVVAEEDVEGMPALPKRPEVVRVQALMPIDLPIEAELLGRLGERVWLHGPLVRPDSEYHFLPVVIKTTRMVPVFLQRPDALEIPTSQDAAAPRELPGTQGAAGLAAPSRP